MALSLELAQGPTPEGTHLRTSPERSRSMGIGFSFHPLKGDIRGESLRVKGLGLPPLEEVDDPIPDGRQDEDGHGVLEEEED